jgi:Protein of unknown function (DUF4197)
MPLQTMKDHKKTCIAVFLIALVAFMFAPGSATAKSSWLDKGKDLFKTVEEKVVGKKESTGLSVDDIGAAFKDALRIGSENVVSKLGSVDGFNTDSAIHIPLPKQFETVKTMLGKAGMSKLTDDLELKLNRAAEAATPKAKALFLQAITEMTFEDVKTIYEGPEDSATKYFQGKMTPSLKEEMQPIVDSSLSEVGAIQSYDKVITKYKTLPFVPDVKADLTEHVLEKGMAGIFYYIAKEEAAIRSDPAKQTTDLLKKVFGKE